jgi:hypothetical protein
MPGTDRNPISELGAAASVDAFLCANGAGTFVLPSSLIPIYRSTGDREGLLLARETAITQRGVKNFAVVISFAEEISWRQFGFMWGCKPVSRLHSRTRAKRGENQEYTEDRSSIDSEIWIISHYLKVCFGHRSPFGMDMKALARNVTEAAVRRTRRR